MSNPYNPSPDDLRAWAAKTDAVEPVQDWDLMLQHLPYTDLYLELAADDTLPQRQFFLHLLYLTVGDAVRTGFRNVAEHEIQFLLERSRPIKHPDIKAWRHRSRELLRAPGTFSYDLWCAGGLAREVA